MTCLRLCWLLGVEWGENFDLLHTFLHTLVGLSGCSSTLLRFFLESFERVNVFVCCREMLSCLNTNVGLELSVFSFREDMLLTFLCLIWSCPCLTLLFSSKFVISIPSLLVMTLSLFPGLWFSSSFSLRHTESSCLFSLFSWRERRRTSESDLRAEDTLGLSGKDLVPDPLSECLCPLTLFLDDILRSKLSGRRSRPMSLATRFGDLALGELQLSEDLSKIRALRFDLFPPTWIWICHLVILYISYSSNVIIINADLQRCLSYLFPCNLLIVKTPLLTPSCFVAQPSLQVSVTTTTHSQVLYTTNLILYQTKSLFSLVHRPQWTCFWTYKWLPNSRNVYKEKASTFWISRRRIKTWLVVMMTWRKVKMVRMKKVVKSRDTAISFTGFAPGSASTGPFSTHFH